MRNVLVTGGAGFIGSAVCRLLVGQGRRVICLDSLTYAGNLSTLCEVEHAPNFRFVQADIGDARAVAALLREERIDGIMHLAAEPHVDPLDRQPGRVRRDQCRRHRAPARCRARLLANLARAATNRLPLPPRLDRRGVR